MNERVIDSSHPSIPGEVRAGLRTFRSRGSWFFALLALALFVPAGFLIDVWSPTLGIWIRTVFATGGVVCMVVAWMMSGREGDVGFVARREVSQSPNMTTGIPETRQDFEETGSKMQWILILVVYGMVLMLLAVLLPF